MRKLFVFLCFIIFTGCATRYGEIHSFGAVVRFESIPNNIPFYLIEPLEYKGLTRNNQKNGNLDKYKFRQWRKSQPLRKTGNNPVRLKPKDAILVLACPKYYETFTISIIDGEIYNFKCPL